MNVEPDRGRSNPQRTATSLLRFTAIAAALFVSSCSSEASPDAAADEAKIFAGVGDEAERTVFLQRDRLPSCGTIEIASSTWTATGKDLTKRDCFFRAVESGQAAELHLVSTHPSGDALRVEEWARTFTGGTGEVFTLFSAEISPNRWKRSPCSGWGMGSGPQNKTKEYPGCTP